jgi:hypothetical protein
MGGEHNLETLLRELSPQLHAEPHVFVSLGSPPAGLAAQARCVFHEAEGTTLILTRATADRAGLTVGEEWAWITLRVHSALGAVGMMAAVATALAEDGISCNPVAGYHHDHLFVQWPARERALAALRRLSAGA